MGSPESIKLRIKLQAVRSKIEQSSERYENHVAAVRLHDIEVERSKRAARKANAELDALVQEEAKILDQIIAEKNRRDT